MKPTLLSLEDFNASLSRHPARKPNRESIIDSLDTVEDLLEWISRADVALVKLRRHLAALSKAVPINKLDLNLRIELGTDKRDQFDNLLALWKQAHQKLVIVEQRTWADLEGEDGPDPGQSDTDKGICNHPDSRSRAQGIQ